MTYKITIERNTLRFAAAHFTTFGGECEPLHGHNYDVTVTIEGDLTEDGWVLDFGEAKLLVVSLCKQIDHRFLLPLTNATLEISEGEDEYEVRHGRYRYVMPKQDVAPLPIDNTTAERLAEWFAGRIVAELTGATNLRRVTVGIEEAPGQSGWFSLSLSPIG